MVLMFRNYTLFIFLVVAFVSNVQADILHAKRSHRPQAQDSVWESPNGIDPSPRETDEGRLALPLREIMQRTYDVSGQKSEWILGTSLLGNPELAPEALGMASVSRRYPSKLAGLYTTRLSYDASTLTLNGDNGILFEERHGIPVDTPITDVNWERGPFQGNAVRLEFRRLLTDSVTLDLGVASHSNLLSKSFDYQNVTHSPYFALGRDSTQIPFGGRNIAMNSMHMQPILTWKFRHGSAYFKMNYLSLDNDDNTTHKVLIDTLDYSIRNFQTDPYNISIETRTYGAGLELAPTRDWTFKTNFTYGTHEIEMTGLPQITKQSKTSLNEWGYETTEYTYFDTTRGINYESILGNFDINYAMLLNPSIHFSYEFLNTETVSNETFKREHYQDREIGYLQISDTLLWKTFFRVQAGMQRNSSVLDTVDFAPAFSIDATVLLPRNFQLNASYRHDNKFPEVSQLRFDETGRVAIHNEQLKFEKRDRGTATIGWFKQDVFYGLGLRFENANNLIKPYWVAKGEIPVEDEADSTETESDSYYNPYTPAPEPTDKDSIAAMFRWANVDNVKTLDWLMQVGFRLGNWKFYLERGQTFKRNKRLMDTPQLYYKGSIHWQNRFVSDRLGVSVRFDWQWFQDRYDCTIDENNKPEIVHLKHYLALDFEARMQILAFELYSRIENLNHSIYMPESGYTPEGLRFAYGIVWTFNN